VPASAGRSPCSRCRGCTSCNRSPGRRRRSRCQTRSCTSRCIHHPSTWAAARARAAAWCRVRGAVKVRSAAHSRCSQYQAGNCYTRRQDRRLSKFHQCSQRDYTCLSKFLLEKETEGRNLRSRNLHNNLERQCLIRIHRRRIVHYCSPSNLQCTQCCSADVLGDQQQTERRYQKRASGLRRVPGQRSKPSQRVQEHLPAAQDAVNVVSLQASACSKQRLKHRNHSHHP